MIMAIEKTSPSTKTGNLRKHIIEAASRVLIEEGYEHLSLRHVAQKAGCSQMAMYRHFANKDALIHYLCLELYTRFTERINRKLNAAGNAGEKVHFFIAEMIGFATAYPDHYSLIFLQRQSDRLLNEERDRLGKEFLQGIREVVQELLSLETPKETVDMRLRQIVMTLHGAAALLLAHPKAYGLSRNKAIQDTEELVGCILRADR